jgi:hypothetical protein
MDERGVVLLPPPVAELAGWLLCGLYHTTSIAAGGVGLSLSTQAFAFGHMVLAGVVVLAAARSWRRLGKKSLAWRVGLFTILVGPLLGVVLETDLAGPVARYSPLSQAASYWTIGFVLAAVLALCREAVWRWFLHGSQRIVPLAAGAALGLGHAWMAPFAYPGLHLLAAATAASVSGAALYQLPLPRPLRALRRLRSAFLILLGLGGVLSVVVSPSNQVLLALEAQTGAVWTHIWAPVWARSSQHRPLRSGAGEWFRSRTSAADMPAHAALLPRENLIVVLLGIDSMRAAILEDEKLRKQLPALFRLRDEGAWFRQARSPGASTATAIAPMFAGKPYSALYWTHHDRRLSEVFPHEDDTPRFTDLLSRAGIPTFTVDTTGWLGNYFEIARGFSEEIDGRVKKAQGPSAYPSAQFAAARLQKRMKRHEDGPLFAYVHFMDAHSPYTSAGPAKTPYRGYLQELRLVDGEISKLRKLLKKHQLDRRTVFIVHADHGEAFGEKGFSWHASTLYDPMIRVPLLIAGPGIQPRTVDEPVSLLDLYPTILDLYGVDTPGHVLGQSLAPLLAGGDEPLVRPIVAEARLKRALITRDLRKIIHDPRSGTVEIYDLRRDPGEEHNLFLEDDQTSQELLDTVSAYFDAHEFRKPGYRTPYRKW